MADMEGFPMADIKEKRNAQVPEQLNRLNNEVSELEKVVDSLRDRLQPVLRNELSDKMASEKAVERLVDVANGIRADTRRISDVVGIVGDIVELLEL